jgi:hypothetical protein
MTIYTVYAKNEFGEISPEEDYTSSKAAEKAAVEMAERMSDNWHVFISIPHGYWNWNGASPVGERWMAE